MALSGTPRTATWPSAISRSPALASSRCAATSSTLSLSCRAPCSVGAAGHGRRPAAAGEPERDHVAVADDDPDLLERHAELVGRDLGERGLVALPVRHLAGEHGHGAVGVEPQPHRAPGPSGRSAPSASRGPGRGLDVGGQADAEVAALRPRSAPAGPEGREVDELGDALQRLRVVTPASGRPVIIGERRLVRGGDVAPPDLERVEAELPGDEVEHRSRTNVSAAHGPR